MFENIKWEKIKLAEHLLPVKHKPMVGDNIFFFRIKSGGYKGSVKKVPQGWKREREGQGDFDNV